MEIINNNVIEDVGMINFEEVENSKKVCIHVHESVEEKKIRQSQAYKKWYDQKGKVRLQQKYRMKESVIQKKIKFLEECGYVIIPPQ
jgi:hypothetical protein